MIQIKAFHHVSIAITDLDKAKHFYGDILGFPELKRPDFDFPGAWYQVGEQQLHLIVYPEAKTLRSTSSIDTKDGHFAIRVKDYDETLRYLKEKNVAVLEKPFSQSGFAQIFCTDPDGNVIEFHVDQKERINHLKKKE
ncbi:VOC family protein [Pullulanibacillus sp. KACC 23026]|uniref:VOC family protein n=1 Tax=Pullulanibacillus sp. KACC 23026 TaxID=3028315 RepID=UPI0023AEEE21|nr:VOC family protein [Pullulanibacillus sp. KACC 23026]WEG11872.1 VOC family protein [Pullulanibacillus sp. KACC 23026]